LEVEAILDSAILFMRYLTIYLFILRSVLMF